MRLKSIYAVRVGIWLDTHSAKKNKQQGLVENNRLESEITTRISEESLCTREMAKRYCNRKRDQERSKIQAMELSNAKPSTIVSSVTVTADNAIPATSVSPTAITTQDTLPSTSQPTVSTEDNNKTFYNTPQIFAIPSILSMDEEVIRFY